MNQIYNLAQTIAADKDTITKLERHLLNAKNILTAHEEAMERLTTVPSVIVSDNGIGAARGSVQEDKPVRERITTLNWKELFIAKGDKVHIAISSQPNHFSQGQTCTITDIEDDFYEGSLFIELDNNMWYCFDYECTGIMNNDELYLIRTPEGSLNK